MGRRKGPATPGGPAAADAMSPGAPTATSADPRATGSPSTLQPGRFVNKCRFSAWRDRSPRAQHQAGRVGYFLMTQTFEVREEAEAEQPYKISDGA